MSYDVRYKTGEDRRAITDLIRYIGSKRTRVLIRCAKDPETTFLMFHHVSAFAGVQGFPVTALWKYAGRKVPGPESQRWAESK